MMYIFAFLIVGTLLWLPIKMLTNTIKSRDGRSSRLWICFKLWLAYIGVLFCGIGLFAGFSWITQESIAIATGIFFAVLSFYYFVTCLGCKLSYTLQGGRKEELFDNFIGSGGDPFWDYMPVPINNDSFVIRALGKTELEREDDKEYYYIPESDDGGGRRVHADYVSAEYHENDDLIENTIPVESRFED